MLWVVGMLCACSESHPASGDASTDDVDALVPEDDASAPSLDAGAPEPCTTPGAIETAACGRCGTTERFCTSAHVWEYGPCTEAPDAECTPGESGELACGMCGAQVVRCTTECRWAPGGTCGGEHGDCVPGQSERDFAGCPSGFRTRICGDDCAWERYDACVLVPDDLDGDGAGRATDCDDSDPTIRPGTTRPCGNFQCEEFPGRITYRPGTSRCAGPGWEVCVRGADCPEPTTCDDFGVPEQRDCAWSGCLPAPTQTRMCTGGRWGSWSVCDDSGAGDPTRPASCEVPEVSSCGTCGEGVRYTTCDATCAPRTGPCVGTGCAPGTTTTTTSGCPAGQYRTSTCSATCTEGTPGPCMAPPPEVDVMILVDVTGSHTGFVMGNATALARELAMPLLSDVDVRVGVSSFADFPVGMYGTVGDEPFRGILAPTADIAMVETALRTVPSQAGGDAPESGLEALFVLLGGTPVPSSAVPFMCPSGRVAGGCWRTVARRAIVMVTDITQHDMPTTGGVIVSPYDASVVAATWDSVRARFGPGTALFALVPAGDGTGGEFDGETQLRYVATQLGQDPSTSVVTYPMGTSDVTAQIRTLAGHVASWISP